MPVVQRLAAEQPKPGAAVTGFAELAAAGPLLVAVGISVLAGLVSFASPCVVPLVPGYLSYLAAVVGGDDETHRSAETTKRHRWATTKRHRSAETSNPGRWA